MTGKGRRAVLVGVWGLAVIAVWFLIPRPPHDDEYAKWFFVSVMHFGFPWLLDLSLALLIALSLERRCGTRRRWIVALWTVTLVGLIWFHVLRPASLGPFDANNTYTSWLMIGFQEFALPELFSFLASLCVVLWLEGKIAGRSLLIKSRRLRAGSE
jgi:hypothetical protein